MPAKAAVALTAAGLKLREASVALTRVLECTALTRVERIEVRSMLTQLCKLSVRVLARAELHARELT